MIQQRLVMHSKSKMKAWAHFTCKSHLHETSLSPSYLQNSLAWKLEPILLAKFTCKMKALSPFYLSEDALQDTSVCRDLIYRACSILPLSLCVCNCICVCVWLQFFACPCFISYCPVLLSAPTPHRFDDMKIMRPSWFVFKYPAVLLSSQGAPATSPNPAITSH